MNKNFFRFEKKKKWLRRNKYGKFEIKIFECCAVRSEITFEFFIEINAMKAHPHVLLYF